MKVELLSHFGDDLMVVNAARVSYGKTKTELDNKDIRLIKYLIDHKHTSPFRHPHLQFRVQCPIFVERQIFKHEVGVTKNSISGRYVDFSDEYWLPTKLRKQSEDSKQGSSGDLDLGTGNYFLAKMKNIVDQCKELYKEMESEKVAKEQARIILPLCLETQFIWTGSLAAFLHMCSLRIKPDAQEETRLVVEFMLNLVQNIEGNPFKYTLEAFGYSSNN